MVFVLASSLISTFGPISDPPPEPRKFFKSTDRKFMWFIKAVS
ncbi:hypothetical protein BFJ66_g6170 [Fusarium oxysporum f. sp. cepae]|jgi:hypothetical protein|uniref:Uncharacterized protein n=1 Tax=Fusarium oxysporum f. sp. cepae TaxID=396571 RepID=A0A3L6NR35_FUSOX|nr:hypothetical protein BFJ65_g7595 [Fusarium oxysporum f. sp. cepae]RKK51260.1 hypothetical protein BFJ66_g6170 [Fusarium oxysporum f. sp. cepae]